MAVKFCQPSFSEISRGAPDLLFVLLEALDVALASRTRLVSIQPLAGDPATAEELWRYLEGCTAAERRLLVEEGKEYQTRELAGLAGSAARAATQPREARELAELAARMEATLPDRAGAEDVQP